MHPNKQLPKHITFQWHITDKCNLRCAHCYQESYTNQGMPYVELLNVLNELVNFVHEIKKVHGTAHAHINFTGGEPFVRNDFIDLLEAARATELFSVGILSNGLLPEQDDLLRLQKLNPSFVQLSMEGSKTTNDSIRGKGSTESVQKAMRAYRELQIPVMLSFTANAENYTEFADVVRFGRKHKAYKVWTDRYLPSGKNDKLQLSKTQTKDYLKILANEDDKSKFHIFSKTKVATHRALQFLVAGGKPYRCTAGETLLAILPNGDVYPCRRLPIVVGNTRKQKLTDIYQNNTTLKELREPSEACGSCYYKQSCKGGLKCLSYAQFGNFADKDPGCWL